MYKLLIVDDEELICNGIKSMIERLNLSSISQVRISFDAQNALSCLSEFRPNIIVTDIRMPGLSGVQLIEEILRFDPSIKCIVISGYGRFQYAKESFKLGAVDYLLKPASIHELRSAILKTISVLDNNNKNQISAKQVDSLVQKDRTSVTVKESVCDSKNALVSFNGEIANSISEAVKMYISRNFSKSVSMAVIANGMDLSYAYFSKIFRDETGVTFSHFLMEYRMREAEAKLKNSDITVREIAASVGYNNPKHFTRAFKNYFGVSPKLYRQNNKQLF